jgi:hypothetical protein
MKYVCIKWREKKVRQGYLKWNQYRNATKSLPPFQPNFITAMEYSWYYYLLVQPFLGSEEEISIAVQRKSSQVHQSNEVAAKC